MSKLVVASPGCRPTSWTTAHIFGLLAAIFKGPDGNKPNNERQLSSRMVLQQFKISALDLPRAVARSVRYGFLRGGSVRVLQGYRYRPAAVQALNP